MICDQQIIVCKLLSMANSRKKAITTQINIYKNVDTSMLIHMYVCTYAQYTSMALHKCTSIYIYIVIHVNV